MTELTPKRAENRVYDAAENTASSRRWGMLNGMSFHRYMIRHTAQ